MAKKESEDDGPKTSHGIGLRHAQTGLMFCAMVLAFAMRVNMSMAIVVMTDSSIEGAFDWSVQTQSVILSSFFWGYVVLQVPAGELAARFGGKIFVLMLIVINSAICVLIPIGSYYGGWQLVCGMRIVQGLSQGFLNPSIHNLIGKWVPLEEKNRLGTFIYAGQQGGTAIQLMISGFIADSWGWPAIFYINGVCGAIWTIVYIFVGADSPQRSKLISEEEKRYIQNSLGHVENENSLESCAHITAFHISDHRALWSKLGFFTLMTEMPTYMSQVLGVNIKANGVLSALPYLAMVSLSLPFGYIADKCIEKKWLSITAVRKISNSIGHYGPAVALIGLTYTPAGNVTVAVILLTIVVGLNAGVYAGFMLVHIDMAPNFAGTLMGITNSISAIISIVAPLVAGALLKDETLASEWRKVFYVSTVIYIVCNTFFVIFGTCKTQSWNEVSETDEKTDAERQKKSDD